MKKQLNTFKIRLKTISIDTIETLAKLNLLYNDRFYSEIYKDRFRFLESDILPLLIPYINLLTQELNENNEDESITCAYCLINILNLINFRQEHPALNEFKKAVKQDIKE